MRAGDTNVSHFVISHHQLSYHGIAYTLFNIGLVLVTECTP